jgi:hypothetical protein
MAHEGYQAFGVEQTARPFRLRTSPQLTGIAGITDLTKMSPSTFDRSLGDHLAF